MVFFLVSIFMRVVFLVLLIFIKVVKMLGWKVFVILYSSCSCFLVIFWVFILVGMFMKYFMLLKDMVSGLNGRIMFCFCFEFWMVGSLMWFLWGSFKICFKVCCFLFWVLFFVLVGGVWKIKKKNIIIVVRYVYYELI